MPERQAAARQITEVAAYASASAALIPLPVADLVVLIPVHTAMVMTMAHVYGRVLTETAAKRVLVELGAVAGVTAAGKLASGLLLRVLLPGIGGFLNAPATFALTWAFGRVAEAYFKNPELSRAELKTLFQDGMKSGRSAFNEADLKDYTDRLERDPEAEAEAKAGRDPKAKAQPSASPAPEGEAAPRDPAHGRMRSPKRTL